MHHTRIARNLYIFKNLGYFDVDDGIISGFIFRNLFMDPPLKPYQYILIFSLSPI